MNQSQHSRPESRKGKAGEAPIETERSERTEVEPADETYDQVGERVAAVLTSAQQAAEEIHRTARQEAERLRVEADDKAAATLAEATLTAKQKRREGDDLRAEADKYSTDVREAADRYVAETRRKVDEEAAQKRAGVDEQIRGIRQAAEQKAKNIETEVLRRHQALVQEAGRSAARLQQLLEVFRGMTSQLEELLRAERATQSHEAEEEAPIEEPLAEALKPQGTSRPTR